MRIHVKTIDGIIEEIYNVSLGEVRFIHGEPFPFNITELSDTKYFTVINTHLEKPKQICTQLTQEQYLKETKHHSNVLIPDLRNGQIYFRFHTSTLAKALHTVCKVDNKEGLRSAILERYKDYIDPNGEMTIEKYGRGIDDRIGWDTYIVLWDKIPQGFLSGELK